MESEVLTAIERFGGNIEEFKRGIDERLRDLEGREAKAFNRPHNGGELRGKDSAEVRAFENYLRTGDGSELKSLNIAAGDQGGYTVPKVISNQIETLLLQRSPIRQYASVVPVSTGDYHHLISLGGATATWAAESDARTVSTAPTFAEVIPPMGDLTASPACTQWLLNDSQVDIAAWLASTLADLFAEQESSAFITGDGTSKPKGFLSYTNVASGDATRAFGQIEYVPTGAAGAFATVSATVSPYDVLMTTVAKMKVGYRDQARWFLSPATLATLSQVKDTVGRHILIPPVTAGTPPMLVGYPVVECEHMPAVASNSYSIAFANMQRAYLIADRTNLRILADPFTSKPLTIFYTVKRTGGCLVNSQAIKLIKFAAS